MSEKIDEYYPQYTGRSELDVLLWASASIIDSERKFHTGMGVVGYKVEWEDEDGLLCELTSEVVPDKEFVGSRDGPYAYTQYIFGRRDVLNNTEQKYVVQTDSNAIDQYGADMQSRRSMNKAERKLAIASILKSYMAFIPEDILSDDEEAAFIGIVENYKSATAKDPFEKPAVGRRLGRAVKNLFTN